MTIEAEGLAVEGPPDDPVADALKEVVGRFRNWQPTPAMRGFARAVAAAALRAQAERVRVLEGAVLDAAISDRLDEAGSPLSWREVAEAAERRAGELEGALETFAVLANEDTDYLPDEHVISLTYDDSDVDPDLGGPDTLLGERFMRAFRRARALLPATQAEGEK